MNGAGQKGFDPFDEDRSPATGETAGKTGGEGVDPGLLDRAKSNTEAVSPSDPRGGDPASAGRRDEASRDEASRDAAGRLPLEVPFLDGAGAAVLVTGIRAAARREAASRGQLLRLTAELYTAALAHHGAHARKQLTDQASWAATALAQGDPDVVVRDVAAEIAVALMLPAGTARETVAEALIFATDLPVVLAALEDGAITWPQARVIFTHWRALMDGAPTVRTLDRMSEHDRQAALKAAATLEAKATALVHDLLTRAPEVTTAQLADYARRRRARIGAAGHQRACAAARKHRDVWVSPEEDGMARLNALLTAPVATAIAARIQKMAATLTDDDRRPPARATSDTGLFGEFQAEDRHPGGSHAGEPGEGPSGNPLAEQRSIGEKRADVFADLLLDGELPETSGFPRGIRGHVTVMVPATTLISHDPELAAALSGARGGAGTGASGSGGTNEDTAHDDPDDRGTSALLAGYGPISDVEALGIAAGASSWRRVLTDAATGLIIEHGRDTYTVPAGLRRLLTVRDETCRFPGCRRQAGGCDLDHTVAWENGGTTGASNLGHLCRLHHRVKHEARTLGTWQVRHIDPGTGLPLGDDHGATAAGAGGTEATAAGQQQAPGVLEWTSPTGVVRRTVPGAATPITTRWLVGNAPQASIPEQAPATQASAATSPVVGNDAPPPF